MTKREQAEMATLREQARLVRTSLLSGHPAPETLAVPQGGIVNGWDMNRYDRGWVRKAWTEGHYSGEGWRGTPDCSPHRSRVALRLYATERDALIALRLAKEVEVAKLLADLDARIAACGGAGGMSLDVDLMVTQPVSVFDANVTHNLGLMAEAAGIYQHLWRPEELSITKAGDLIAPLERGLALLKAEPERFRAHNPPNGWGTYDGFVPWVERYLNACREHPDADVRVSR